MKLFAVLFALAGVFAGLALVTSQVLEMIATRWKWRPEMLRKTLERILGQEQAQQLLAHKLIKPLITRDDAPSYIPADLFATVVTDVDNIEQVADLRRLLGPQGLHQGIIRWYELLMERASGEYKSRTMWVAVLIGMMLAAAIDLDLFALVGALANDPKLLPAVDKVLTATKDADAATVKSLWATLNLPGWSVAKWQTLTWPGGLQKFISYAICGLCASQGAPFWFDWMNKIASVRGAGPKPAPADGTLTPLASPFAAARGATRPKGEGRARVR